MTNLTTQILVQNVETFSTITTCDSMDAFDAWLETAPYGIVSLDSDADGEYGFVALVAAQDGPDFMMDTDTGEMEPVEDIEPAAELAAKMDIMMELDMNDVAQEDILAMLADTPEQEPAAIAKAPITTQPRNKRKSKSKAKGAKMSTQPTKIRNFEILASHIEANPGVSRTDIFSNQGLLHALRTTAQVALINNGDKTEVKRWNRRLNFLLREMRRQAVNIQIERKGRIAHYTIKPASGQLELPFDDAAEARNSAIIGDDVTNEVIEAPVPPKQDAMRLVEEPNQNLDFESLLATLDDDAATVLSDDQVAFNEARAMLK